jgi:hypothetical protein
MYKRLLLLFTFFIISCGFSQEIFIQTGKNMTTLDFKILGVNSDLNFRYSSGNFYEVGILYPINDVKLDYKVSIILNEWNAAASNGLSNYSWNTSYLGIQNKVSHAVFKSTGGLQISVEAGVNISTIIKGEQFINHVFYDIKDNEEFTGIMLQPSLGFLTQYEVSPKMSLSIGYHFSKALNLTNASQEKVNFKNHQVQFGFNFPL